MSISTTIPPATSDPRSLSRPRRANPVLLVLGCTLFAAVAQVLLKFGALHPMPAIQSGLVALVAALLGNWQLMLGYSLHACNAMLLILALREGQLSVLYPVYALSYIWVDLLSLYFFHEQMNGWKAAGIALIIGGVAQLGRVSTKS